MITDDEIMRMFELADPARHDDGAGMVGAAGYLDALQTRSNDMQLIDTTEAPSKSPRNNRWVLGTSVAAAAVLIVAGALILTRDDGEEVPGTTPPTTVTPAAPTTVPEQSGEQSVDEAIALVRSYFDARNAYDDDLATGYLTGDVAVDCHGGPDELCLGIGSWAATGGQAVLGDCAPVDDRGPGIGVRCEFDYRDFRSDALGLGPFGDNSVDLTVVDGKITSIDETTRYATNGYEKQLWKPFDAWIDAQHPDDAAVIYGGTQTAEWNRLWEQRSREYVELRLTAERAATEFFEAFGAFDAEAAGSHLADGASTERIVTEDVQDYRQAIELYRAWGYEQQLGACQQVGATETGLQVRCPFAYHLLGSRELGLGPFDGSYFTAVVDNETGMISEVDNTWFGFAFSRDVTDPFTDWVTATHPEAVATMAVEGGPALTPESLALWEQLRHEYVQSVLGSTPPTTAAA